MTLNKIITFTNSGKRTSLERHISFHFLSQQFSFLSQYACSIFGATMPFVFSIDVTSITHMNMETFPINTLEITRLLIVEGVRENVILFFDAVGIECEPNVIINMVIHTMIIHRIPFTSTWLSYIGAISIFHFHHVAVNALLIPDCRIEKISFLRPIVGPMLHESTSLICITILIIIFFTLIQ